VITLQLNKIWRVPLYLLGSNAPSEEAQIYHPRRAWAKTLKWSEGAPQDKPSRSRMPV
jgi:hypothetical protein